MPIRVVLIEDNEVFRQALELLLGQHGDIDIVASEPTGENAVELCKLHGPESSSSTTGCRGRTGFRSRAASAANARMSRSSC